MRFSRAGRTMDISSRRLSPEPGRSSRGLKHVTVSELTRYPYTKCGAEWTALEASLVVGIGTSNTC